MSDTPDLSKIVSLIMENPGLVSEIQSLIKKDRGTEETADSVDKDYDENVPTSLADSSEASVNAAANLSLSRREKRARLFSGLKPYLSDERRRTVDTVLTFADMLEAVRGK